MAGAGYRGEGGGCGGTDLIFQNRIVQLSQTPMSKKPDLVVMPRSLQERGEVLTLARALGVEPVVAIGLIYRLFDFLGANGEARLDAALSGHLDGILAEGFVGAAVQARLLAEDGGGGYRCELFARLNPHFMPGHVGAQELGGFTQGVKRLVRAAREECRRSLELWDRLDQDPFGGIEGEVSGAEREAASALWISLYKMIGLDPPHPPGEGLAASALSVVRRHRDAEARQRALREIYMAIRAEGEVGGEKVPRDAMALIGDFDGWVTRARERAA